MLRHEISSGLFYHWQEQYARGQFNNESTKEAALEYRAEHRHLVQSTERGCRLMNLPLRTYCHKSKNGSGDDRQLIKRIEAIIEECPGYGYRRVTRELHRRGDPSS
jgi:hypothetical protein